MLFQCHVRVDQDLRSAADGVVLDALAQIAHAVETHGVRAQAVYSAVSPYEAIGYWSISDATEDLRIARIRNIAQNLERKSVNPLGPTFQGAERADIARALLAAIDGNPAPQPEVT